MNISSRHEGSLAGKLREFDPNLAIQVRVVISLNVAHLASVQMTAAFLINLISRFEGVLTAIEIVCPINVQTVGRLSPLDGESLSLIVALESINAEIGVVPLTATTSTRKVLVVGGPAVSSADLYLLGAGWCGGAHTAAFELIDSTLPFGPYIAACIAAAELFKWARMDSDRNRFKDGAFLSAWSNRVETEPFQDGPFSPLPAIDLTAALAGVGAVGSAYLHTIWALSGATGVIDAYDNDSKGIEDTNLNRYVFFGRNDVGKFKATQAALAFAGSGLSLRPHDSDVGSAPILPNLLLSAVDTNRARSAIQNRYPARILSASTQDLRAEVLSAGPPGVGACIRCHNPPEQEISDNELYDRLFDSADLQAVTAESLGESLDTIREAAVKRQCSTTTERILGYLKRSADEPVNFAVSFVSALAGVLLASEHCKSQINGAPILGGDAQWLTFQFFDPTSSVNSVGFLPRDSQCPLCIPGDFGTMHWQVALQNLLTPD